MMYAFRTSLRVSVRHIWIVEILSELLNVALLVSCKSWLELIWSIHSALLRLWKWNWLQHVESPPISHISFTVISTCQIQYNAYNVVKVYHNVVCHFAFFAAVIALTHWLRAFQSSCQAASPAPISETEEAARLDIFVRDPARMHQNAWINDCVPDWLIRLLRNQQRFFFPFSKICCTNIGTIGTWNHSPEPWTYLHGKRRRWPL